MTGRSRRLVVVTSRFPFGSQEAYLSAELEELCKYFRCVTVIPVRPPASPARHPVPGGVEILDWPLWNGQLLLRAARVLAARPLLSVRTLARVIASRDPGRLKNLAVLVKGLALAEWAIEHGVDHVHAYWMSTPATVAMIAGEISGARWSATAHRWDIYERNAFDSKERGVEFVRAISMRGADDLRTRMPRLDGRIAHMRLGIVVPPAIGRPQPNPVFRIVCPAALVEVKGHATLFAALAQLRAYGIPVHCTLYGTGPLKNDLERLVAALGLRNAVEFAGFVPQKTLHDEYRAGRFAAMVLASRSAGERMMEGLPTALLEAMAFGVPVVATDSGSVREVLDERCGLLVPPDDPKRLAAALLHVCRDPDAALVRAQRAYEIVSSRHNVRTQARELAVALYGKVG